MHRIVLLLAHLTASTVTATAVPDTNQFHQPLPRDDPLRKLNYTFYPLMSWGDGCPGDMSRRNNSVVDFMFGFRTMDELDIWGLAINLPGTMRPSVGPGIAATESKKTCFHAWKLGSPDFSMRLHKAGTWTQATYELSEGVTAVWRTTYFIPAKNYEYSFLYDPPASNVRFTINLPNGDHANEFRRCKQ
jgi:hypothetical protein